jgi:phosphoribosyl 1,2-cyclic phosphodiesterase
MSSWRLKLKFWGVRGSTPTPDPRNLGYGGNTPCLEIQLPEGDIVILDAGTGIRKLGLDLIQHGPPNPKIHLFLTHFHWDHIQGIPFFAPLFDNGSVSIYSGTHPELLKEALVGLMRYPYFPIDFEALPSKHAIVDLGEDPAKIGDLTIYPFPVNHPQGACGFRLERQGATIVYAPDREHGHSKLDGIFLKYAEGADILVPDSQYTPEEFQRFKGWGHSTWTEAARVARESKAEQLILFHHDPEHDDAQLTGIVNEARAEFENVSAACEGWTGTL